MSVTLIFCVHVNERDATKSVTQRRHGKEGGREQIMLLLVGNMDIFSLLTKKELSECHVAGFS